MLPQPVKTIIFVFMIESILLIILIAFAATLFRSTFGFGEALIAVPLLSIFIPMSTAVPLAVMMSILVAAIILIQDHAKVQFHSAKWLILFAIIGIPFGLALIFFGNETIVKIILGAAIILYSLYTLLNNPKFYLENDSKLWLFICGFLSGIFGGAYGVNGPPLVVYGNLRRWDAQNFRATLQAYFLVAGAISMAGYIGNGMINTELLLDFAYTIPAIIPAIFIGRYLNHKIKGESFYTYVYVGLILIGAILILNAVI